tara:strand:+ start:302 stop:523 length:222 start_codon:yes stop_codon:yes gene_type:complete
MSREAEIQKLCVGVIELSLEAEDDPNGTYNTSCPCCGKEVKGYSYREWIAENMKTFPHDPSCIYLIALDLSTI